MWRGRFCSKRVNMQAALSSACMPSLSSFHRARFLQSSPPSPACCGQRALERCCTKTGQRRRRGAGDALARRIVAHVSTREPQNGHNNSKKYVFEFLRQFLQLSPKPVRRRRTCRKGISGEVHGNLEADLAVLTPACGSCTARLA